MGRTIGAMAAAVAVAVVVRVVSGTVTSADTSAQDWVVLAPALAAAVYGGVRLLCWSLLWSRPRATPPDRRARSAAEAALDRTEVAVVCDGESLVLVRTATIAAIASTGAPSRVLLVGADPRLDQIGRSLGVRRVTSGIGPRAGIAAAVAAATGEHLVLTSAASAVLPGALRPALEQFDRGTVWVQAEPVAPGDRALLDHVRHDRWWPSLDARGAMPWLGFGSIVLVEAFRTLPVARGAAACTVAAQRRGWRGRWHRPMIAVEQVDASAARDREIDARADRLRSVRGLRSPIWARGLTRWQRLAHVATLVEDLAGAAAVTAVSAVAAALALGELPLPFDAWAWSAPIAVALAWLARLLLTGGLVRPVGMCRAATDDIAPSLRAAARSMRRTGRTVDVPTVATSRRGWRSQIELLALVLVVDVALAWRVSQVLATDDDARRLLTEGSLLIAGASTVACLLASARVLRRNRSLRGSRRLPVDIAARIGTHQGRVLDLAAGGMRVEFGAPADLLVEFPVQLVARGQHPVEVRAQVVRVESRTDTWVLGMRLAGGGLAGEHDDYLALWLWQMAGAAEERPRREPDPVVGRMPVRAGGMPVLRLLTAAAMVAAGVAVLPPTSGRAAGPAAASIAEQTTTSTGPTTSAAPPTSTEPGDDEADVDAGADAGAETDVGSTGASLGPGDADGSADGEETGEGAATPTPRARPLSSVDGLILATSVDDADRQVEGGQVITHTATLRNDGDTALSSASVLVAPDVGVIDATSLAGTCAGADTGATAVDGPATVGWTLFGTAGSLAPGTECTVTWRESLPAATELEDGSMVTSSVSVTDQGFAGRSGTTDGPSVVDELVVRRATLRLTASAGDGTAVDQMTIGQPFTWVLTVANISPGPVTAHGIDLVHSLPKNWVYTATVSVSPPTCDVAPVVLVDDAAGTQTATWSDMCDLDQGDELVLAFSATPQEAAIDDPGVVDAAGEPIAHVSEVALTAEDVAGNPLGSAGDRAGAIARTVDLVARLTDVGPDDGTANDDPAVVVGGLGRYRVDVANEGPDATTGPVTVSVDVPDGMVAISAVGDGWECALGATVECTSSAAIQDGDAAPPVVVGVAVGSGALVDDGSDDDPDLAIGTATATVSGGGLDRDTSNDADGESTRVRRDVDVALTGVLSGTTPIAPGARVDWILTPIVVGPAAVTGELVLEDAMPQGLRFVSARGRGWACGGSRVGTGYASDPDTNGVLSCRRQLRDAGVGTALDALVVNVQIDPGFAGDPPIPGRVALAGDRNPSNDLAQPSAAPGPVAELSILAVTGSRLVQVGEELTYEVVVTNQGPAADEGEVAVHAEVAAGLSIGAVVGDGWACTVDAPSDLANGSWTCTWDGSAVPVVSGMLLPGIEVTATVSADAVPNLAPSARESFEHTVTVTGSASGPEPISSTLTWIAAPETTNTVSLVDRSSGAWRTGEPHDVQVVVGNDGPSGEYGPVVVQIPVTAAIELMAADGDGWACGVTTRGVDADDPEVTRTVECTYARRRTDYGQPVLDAGETLPPIDMTLVPAADGEATQAVRVMGVTDDVAHRSALPVQVGRSAAMSIDVAAPEVAYLGEDMVVTVTVTNDGPSPSATPATLTIGLPAGIEIVAVDGGADDWSCDGRAAAVVCTAPNAIAPDATSVLSLTAAVGAATETDDVAVTAMLTADPADAASEDDVDVDTVDVRPGESSAAADPTTSAPETAAAAAGSAPISTPRDVRPSDLLGYSGAAGALAFAIVLVSGRRRRGW